MIQIRIKIDLKAAGIKTVLRKGFLEVQVLKI